MSGEVRSEHVQIRLGHFRSPHAISDHDKIVSGNVRSCQATSRPVRFGEVKCSSKSGKIKTRSCLINSGQSQVRESQTRLGQCLAKVRSGQVMSRAGQVRSC